jgi:hypothetical protein
MVRHLGDKCFERAIVPRLLRPELLASTLFMHLCNRWGTGEIKIFRGSDHAQIGSVKLLEDADSIGYDPDTKHLYATNGGGGAHLEYALASGQKWAVKRTSEVG